MLALLLPFCFAMASSAVAGSPAINWTICVTQNPSKADTCAGLVPACTLGPENTCVDGRDFTQGQATVYSMLTIPKYNGSMPLFSVTMYDDAACKTPSSFFGKLNVADLPPDTCRRSAFSLFGFNVDVFVMVQSPATTTAPSAVTSTAGTASTTVALKTAATSSTAPTAATKVSSNTTIQPATTTTSTSKPTTTFTRTPSTSATTSTVVPTTAKALSTTTTQLSTTTKPTSTTPTTTATTKPTSTTPTTTATTTATTKPTTTMPTTPTTTSTTIATAKPTSTTPATAATTTATTKPTSTTPTTTSKPAATTLVTVNTSSISTPLTTKSTTPTTSMANPSTTFTSATSTTSGPTAMTPATKTTTAATTATQLTSTLSSTPTTDSTSSPATEVPSSVRTTMPPPTELSTTETKLSPTAAPSERPTTHSPLSTPKRVPPTCLPNITVATQKDASGAAPVYAPSSPYTIQFLPRSGSPLPIGRSAVAMETIGEGDPPFKCIFFVSVVDQQPPKLQCPVLKDLRFNTTGDERSVMVVLPWLGAIDNSGQVFITANPANGSFFGLGRTAVRVTATDASGNKASCNLTVEVFGTPLFSAPPPLVTSVSQDRVVAVACNVTGHPPPLVAWTRNEAVISSGVVASLVLVLPAATLADGGDYFCSASNVLGAVDTAMTLSVTPYEIACGSLASDAWLMERNLPNRQGLQYSNSGSSSYHVQRSLSRVGATTGIVVTSSLFYFGAGRLLSARSVGTNALGWSVDLGARVSCTPAVDDTHGMVFVGTDDGRFHARVASTGKALFVFNTTNGKAIRASPVFDFDRPVAFFGDDGGVVYAVRMVAGEDLQPGQLLWKTDAVFIKAIAVAPVLQGTMLVVADIAGAVQAIDALSGEQLWKREFLYTGSVLLAASSQSLFVSDGNRTFYSLALNDGLGERWKIVAAVGPLTGAAFTDDGKVLRFVFFADGSAVRKVSVSTGQVLASAALLAPASGAPIVGGDGLLYVADQSGQVVAFDTDLEVQWNVTLPDQSGVFPLAFGPPFSLYAATHAGVVVTVANCLDFAAPIFARVGKNGLRVSWLPVDSGSGAVVTGFRLRVDDELIATTSGSAVSYTLQLRPNKYYEVSLAVVLSVGAGVLGPTSRVKLNPDDTPASGVEEGLVLIDNWSLQATPLSEADFTEVAEAQILNALCGANASWTCTVVLFRATAPSGPLLGAIRRDSGEGLEIIFDIIVSVSALNDTLEYLDNAPATLAPKLRALGAPWTNVLFSVGETGQVVHGTASSATKAKDSQLIWIIIYAVAGTAGLVLILLVLICCCRFGVCAQRDTARPGSTKPRESHRVGAVGPAHAGMFTAVGAVGRPPPRAPKMDNTFDGYNASVFPQLTSPAGDSWLVFVESGGTNRVARTKSGPKDKGGNLPQTPFTTGRPAQIEMTSYGSASLFPSSDRHSAHGRAIGGPADDSTL